jgi:hypothetical protein
LIKTAKRLEGRGNDLNTRGRKRDWAAFRVAGLGPFARDPGEKMGTANPGPETSSGVTAACTGEEIRNNRKKATVPAKFLRVFKIVLRSADGCAYSWKALGT